MPVEAPVTSAVPLNACAMVILRCFEWVEP